MTQHVKRQFVVVVDDRPVELVSGVGARRAALLRARDFGGASVMSVGEYVTRRFVPENAEERRTKAHDVAREDAAWENTGSTLADLPVGGGYYSNPSWMRPTPLAWAAEAAQAASLEIDLSGVEQR